MTPSPRRYRAFISYSHQDSPVARWLHRALESYRMPAHLARTLGLPSRRLRPIFRDRDELRSASSLTTEVRRALENSDALIVVCSAASAASRWVNQEIYEFVALGRAERIFCVLVDSFESFPRALADCGIKEPLAPDIRAGADGRLNAKLKLVAALLGVGFDDLAQRDRQQRRRTFVVRAAAFGGAMAAAAALTVWLAAADPCPDPVERMAGVWDTGVHDAVARAFGRSKQSFAGDTWNRVVRVLDAYAVQWRNTHVQACTATHVSGQQSGELLDKRMACLTERLYDLRAIGELFAKADDEIIENAVDAASALPSLDRCSDQNVLQAIYPPPAAEQRESIAALTQRLAAVRARAEAGRFEAAFAEASSLLPDIEAAAYPPLIANAYYVLGGIQFERGDPKLAGTLQRAAYFASQARDDELVANVWMKLLMGYSEELDSLDEAKVLLPVAEASVARLGANHPSRAQLATHEGAIAYREGRLADAKIAFQRAVALERESGGRFAASAMTNLATVLKDLAEYKEGHAVATSALEMSITRWGPEHPQTTEPMMVLGAIAENEGRLDDALAMYQRALTLRRSTYGATQSSVVLALRATGWVQKEMGRFEEARVALEETLRIYLANRDTPRFHLAEIYNALGDLATYRGDLDAAERAFRDSIALWETYPRNPNVAIPLSNLGALQNRHGRFEAALTTCERVRTIDAEALGTDHPDYAFSLTCLGEAMVGLKRYAEAREVLSTAVELRSTGKPWEIGWTKFQLARATYPQDGSGAVALAHNALELLTRENAPDPYHVQTTRAWLAARDR